MAFEVTQSAQNAALATDLKPNIVLKIDGIDQIFSTNAVLTPIVYGMEGLEYGEGDIYGGLRPIANNLPYISFKLGTSTTIRQQLNPDHEAFCPRRNCNPSFRYLRQKVQGLLWLFQYEFPSRLSNYI